MKNQSNLQNSGSVKQSLVSIQIGVTATGPVGISRVIIPKAGALPAGTYTSSIVEATDVIVDDACVAVDFIHELVDTAGVTRLVRFRVFENELAPLLQHFASYGLTGSLSTALPGLREEVTVQPRTNSSYLHIAARTLSALPSVIPASPPTPSSPSPKPNALRRALQNHKRPVPTPAATNEPEEADDEFDDFYEGIDDDDNDLLSIDDDE